MTKLQFHMAVWDFLQWGAVERQPRHYDWSGYRQVIDLIKSLGLKVQAVMSFHACGGNVGDSAQVPLPSWVMKVCCRTSAVKLSPASHHPPTGLSCHGPSPLYNMGMYCSKLVIIVKVAVI